MSKTYEFTITVVGKGESEQEAWADAKSAVEQYVYDDQYTSSKILEDKTDNHNANWVAKTLDLSYKGDSGYFATGIICDTVVVYMIRDSHFAHRLKKDLRFPDGFKVMDIQVVFKEIDPPEAC